MNLLRITLLLIGFGVISPINARAAELDRRQRTVLSTINSSIGKAAQSYFQGDYQASGQELRKAMTRIQMGIKANGPEFYDALPPLMQKLSLVHMKLELEGVALPPLRYPERPAGDSAMTESAPGDNTPTTNGESLVSFTQDVAPILTSKCGRCHVQGSRGGFNAASYAALMKGPPEGVVVFAGDATGSRLVETIESGDMPRGGGTVSPTELQTLKSWIVQGAKFDGQDPSAPITAGAPATNASPTPAPMITQSRGDETVSFVSDVAPLLVENCSGCHIDAMQVRGGLQMDTFTRLMRGGDSGAIVTPGRGEASLLVKKLRGTAADGERMPAGGRPALSEDEIKLISTWIDEGASIDGDATRPLTVLSRLAWAEKASTEELSTKRAELAESHLQLANTQGQPSATTTDHFRVTGTGSEATLELVGRLAEEQLQFATSVARERPNDQPQDYFRGRATIVVLPRRYDYSEFAKMVEQRSLPSDWTSHWQFDGIDAYVAMVATEQDDPETLRSRLLAPVVSLAVATHGTDVPRWFAEGIGEAIAMQQNAKSPAEQDQMRTLLLEAASTVKDAKAFLDNRLTPAQADSFGAGVAMSMLSRNRRKALESCLRALADGKPFEAAFAEGFGMPPEAYINQFLQYTR
ncbi:hypothetical protein FYK55_09905 [Roseiconus nitratireducens]|uniref:Cytochrome c domain-containing protein n=1 Tax=Roseiconus nitratireducens TaxID=2605748 RepID=A0A5M6DDU3_9BACT|nr:c-type cytochrome domain-containing protein [Roseiconus nitratireducens]KAA5544616.1 hypothetical protein FYK55_09905 [Roseiconus nitratireducens]